MKVFWHYKLALLLLICLLGGSLSVQADSGGMDVGQGTTANFTLSTDTWNFAVTSSGAQTGITLTNIILTVNRGNAANEAVTVTVFGGLGGTGSALYTTNIAATNFSTGGGYPSLSFALGPVTITNAGGYSVQVSTTASQKGSDTYQMKGSPLALDANGVPLNGLYWQQDQTANGTASTNFNSPDVLADYHLSTTNINFGSYHINSNLTATVGLTNSAISTTNNATEKLYTVATATNGQASLTGLSTNLLADTAYTNFIVGLNSAVVGTNTGSILLNFSSYTNGTAAVRTPGGPSNIASQVIGVSGVGYNLAQASVATTNVDLGRIHAGGTFISQYLVLSNSAPASMFSETLGATFGTATGSAVGTGSLTNLTAGSSSNSNMSVGINDNTAGAKSGTLLLNFTSREVNGSGLGTTLLAGQNVSVTGFVYSGHSFWNLATGGVWSNVANWDFLGGIPGLDGILSTNDSAIFGAGPTSGTTTISLAGANPTLAALTFSNSSASYIIAPGGGGTLTIGGTNQVGAISVLAGSNTISAPMVLGNVVVMNVSNASDVLVISSAMSGTGSLVKVGSGTAVLSGTETYTGGTTVSNGTLDVTGSVGGLITVQSNATLSGYGYGSNVVVASGGILDPGILTSNFYVSNLTLSNNSLTRLEIQSATIHDFVTVSNSMTLVNSPKLTLALTNGWSQSANVGQTIVLFNNVFSGVNGGWDGTNTLFQLVDPGGSNNGLMLTNGTVFAINGGTGTNNYFQINYFGGTGGNDIVLTVIPEPSTINLILLIGMLYWMRAFLIRRKIGQAGEGFRFSFHPLISITICLQKGFGNASNHDFPGH